MQALDPTSKDSEVHLTLRDTTWQKSLILATTVWHFSVYKSLTSEDIALDAAVCELVLS